ncbi:MAG TPA: hypothetical protein VMR81_03770 [Patescibacteria group bacterium]|nr:hypothetical protein [Patescibacteria group bacterium]
MSNISELGGNFENGRIPDSITVFDTFDIPAWGKGDLEGLREDPFTRYRRVVNLTRWLNEHDKAWKEEYNLCFVGLASIFGTRQISTDDMTAYSQGDMDKKIELIHRLAKVNELGMYPIVYEHDVHEFMANSTATGLLLVSDITHVTIPFLPQHDARERGLVSFETSYLDFPGVFRQPYDIIEQIRIYKANLLAILPLVPMDSAVFS